jgi:hypothetical protein
MVDTHQVQKRCMQIMDMHLVLNGRKSEFIGSTISHPASHTTTSKPNRETMIIVVSPLRTL